MATEIIGHLDFVETLFLGALARRPTPEEKSVINAILVVSLDHGLTPSSIAARLTSVGAPESVPAAVAAGLLGAGSRYLGPSVLVAQQFEEWTADLQDDAPAKAYESKADSILDYQPSSGKRFLGYGHPIHKDGDPRVPALRSIANENGFYRKGWKLADVLSARLAAKQPSLPMNAAGAVGVTVFDMALDPVFAAGLTLVGRCGGLIAHILEEKTAPIGQDIWKLIATQDPRVDFGEPT